MFYLLKGFVIGFSIAAPVGVIGLLCIRRSLAYGRLSGLISGLGAATADMCYGAVAAFGLSFISTFLLHEKTWLHIIGGIFICYLGAKIMLSQPAKRTPSLSHKGLLTDYLSTFGLTIANPMTILSFLAIFAGIGVGAGHYTSAAWLVAGVFLGSATWWLILSSAVGLLHYKFNERALFWIDRGSGLIILLFGLFILLPTVLS